ncbi:DUF4230 domain-containing protein [Tessaracoccus oleiagri]|uniref:DUF4230 domain-containing protein n=1 Tax=Tessaracoccus oleiagri TaxID=686624 RepID=A0A1G9L6F7_9ACTN|nr:DUF4230 domain-containing protein [Tessaracoccus oleiagri]SDL57155.1 hypothetical protein SAMN04488242_2036 [Tessaracoccus oleiagri]
METPETKPRPAWPRLAGALILGGLLTFLAMKAFPESALFGGAADDRGTRVVSAVTREEQVVLLSLGIQGISEKTDRSTFMGVEIPGSQRASFLQYSFDAKLGIEGGEVSIRQVDEDTVRITIPEFVFIGHDNESFRLAAENNGLLSWITPEADTIDMINEILDDGGQQDYIDANKELLMEQAETFYSSIVEGVDPDIEVKFDFSATR